MGKTIIIPEDYQPSNNQCGTLTLVSGNTYTGADITITQVKNAIGETTTNLGALVTSTKRNKWAAFKPGTFNLSGWLTAQYVLDNPTDGYRLGDYLGYNHNAKPPVYYVDAIPASVEVEEWDNLIIPVRLARGEALPVAYPAASKTRVDIQVTRGSTTTNDRISIPAVGSTILRNISLYPTGNETIDIKPFYYTDEGGGNYSNVAAIEDGFKSVAVTVVPVKITGTITDLPDTTGGNPLTSIPLNWSLTRNASTTKGVYARIVVSGSGITTFTSNLNYLEFAGNETKSGTVYVDIESFNNVTTTVTIKLQIGNGSGFANTQDIAQSSFVWANPGLPG